MHESFFRPLLRCVPSLVLGALALQACGGGGGGGSVAPPPPANPWTAGVFKSAQTYVAQCASPRTGTDPFTHQAYPDQPGTSVTENNWLRSWTHELYLWYAEVPDQDPALFTTPAYFQTLKTPAVTASGHAKDKFHFTYPTAQWEALSQSGVSAEYGAEWVVAAATPPRQIVVGFTEPGSPATSAALARGATVLTVDGVDAVNGADVSTLNAGLFPATSGESHTFEVLDAGAANSRTITMVSADVTLTPVQNVMTLATGTGPVGYVHFSDHIATAEQLLIAAVNSFLTPPGVTDLILDLRYNGGGYLDIASELAFMIAGPGPTAGQTFELQQFNAQWPTTNPIDKTPITPVPFHTVSQGFSGPAGQPLPTLKLARVFVITGSGTCSASESIINALQGVGVQVIQVGSTTCGKPYGFYPQDNCGTTYFTIEFQDVNAKGFGAYADGFSPANTPGTIGAAVPGCSVADDFNHALGDALEGRLAAALGYRASASCPAASGTSSAGLGDGVMAKSALRTNRILHR
jgi:hypothetical protein